MSKSNTSDILYPDDRDDNGGGEFSDFLPDDAGEADLDKLKDIRKVVGRPLSELLTSIDKIAGTREMMNLRGLRFGSAYEAIRWLFEIGIFHYSKIVNMGGGAWAVAIGTSDPSEDSVADDEEGNDDGIIF